MKLKQLLRSRDFLLMLLLSAVVSGVCFTYLFAAGIPMTKARTEYSIAFRAYEAGKTDQALEHLQASLAHWDSKDARDLQEKIQNESE